MVDGEGAVGELDAAEEGFEIGMVEDGDVGEGCLITICSARDRLFAPQDLCRNPAVTLLWIYADYDNRDSMIGIALRPNRRLVMLDVDDVDIDDVDVEVNKSRRQILSVPCYNRALFT